MTGVGVIYVASRHLRFLCEAIASAESVKQHCPELSISLFTDLPHAFTTRIEPFDGVHVVDSGLPGHYTGDASWALGLHMKVLSLIRSPYDKTIFLDGDTRVLSGDLVHLFDELDECSIALVACTPARSKSCRLYGPMFNCGVIAWRTDPSTRQLFSAWEALNRSHLLAASEQRVREVPYLAHLDDRQKLFMLLNDQTSFARLLSPAHNEYGIAVKSLDDRWNARNRPRDGLASVVVDHANCYKVAADEAMTFLAARGLLEPLIGMVPHTSGGQPPLHPEGTP